MGQAITEAFRNKRRNSAVESNGKWMRVQAEISFYHLRIQDGQITEVMYVSYQRYMLNSNACLFLNQSPRKSFSMTCIWRRLPLQYKNPSSNGVVWVGMPADKDTSCWRGPWTVAWSWVVFPLLILRIISWTTDASITGFLRHGYCREERDPVKPRGSRYHRSHKTVFPNLRSLPYLAPFEALQ